MRRVGDAHHLHPLPAVGDVRLVCLNGDVVGVAGGVESRRLERPARVGNIGYQKPGASGGQVNMLTRQRDFAGQDRAARNRGL